MSTITTAVPINLHIALKTVAAQRRMPLKALMVEYLTSGLKRDGMKVEVEDE